MQLRKCTQIVLIIGFLLISFCFGISSMAQQIKPVADSPQQPGAEFTVDIRVENVDNLFGVAFLLHYTHNTDYIDALSAVKGDFLGGDVLFLDPAIDDTQGTVSIGITRKRPADGVNGSGVVAKVTFKSESATPDGTSVDFTITNIVANDPDGTAIPLTPQPLTVIINQPVTHTVTITTGPTAVPATLPPSGGDVNLSVTAEDSQGHAIDYSWTVSPAEGSFDDATKQNPVWTAPANPTASNKLYTLTVTASCSVEPNIQDTDSVQVTVESSSLSAIIKPVADSPQKAGAEFIVDIRVENVENLFGVAFLLHYTHNTDYIDALSAVKGDFLGGDVLFLDPVINDSQGTVSIGITRKRPASGVSGSGVVARVTFKSESATPDGTSVDFTITDIAANDPSGIPISLTPQSLTVTITSVECLRGDVSGDGTISAYDASLILQYVVGLITEFPVNKVGAPNHNSSPRNYTVMIPEQSAKSGDRIDVPIVIEDATGLLAGGISLKYDPTVLRAVDVTAFPLLSGSYWQASIQLTGEVRIAFAGTVPLQGKGNLLKMEFEVLPETDGKTSPLILSNVDFFNSLTITKQNGYVTVLAPKFALLQNYPNPFNPETWIPYQLADAADVTVEIYSVTGDLIKSINLGRKVAGSYMTKKKAVRWDGRNELGEKVASGVYFVSLRAGKFRAIRRMVLVK